MAKNKYYVVWEGSKPGIYDTWSECQAQTNGYPQAKFKAYQSEAEAQVAFKEGWKKHWGKSNSTKSKSESNSTTKSKVSQAIFFEEDEEIDYDSISVDVGTRGNPGPIEYKGVDTRTGEMLFQVGPIENGTNNLGEFIAIIHGLSYLKKLGSNKTVYTDSKTALSWIRKKKVSSTLVRDESTKKIWELTDRALKWLQNNTYENKVLKWNTEKWGEIKADYGRK
jgi:ribonuclease HI